MKIISIEFVKSVYDVQFCPDDHLPQIAFSGRSNVGKSSLINSLLHRKKIALVSSTPGKTQAINFFLINNAFYFVDLPGYGYARVSKKMSKEWQMLIGNYLEQNECLKGLVTIIDARHPLSPLDIMLFDWLYAKRIQFCVAATKADKLTRNKLNIQLDENLTMLEEFHVQEIIKFSSVTGLGQDELWKIISLLMNS
jgi:GTP-binding protein